LQSKSAQAQRRPEGVSKKRKLLANNPSFSAIFVQQKLKLIFIRMLLYFFILLKYLIRKK
jgi:hypothetical protein